MVTGPSQLRVTSYRIDSRDARPRDPLDDGAH
jgi:hypothetical protein